MFYRFYTFRKPVEAYATLFVLYAKENLEKEELNCLFLGKASSFVASYTVYCDNEQYPSSTRRLYSLKERTSSEWLLSIFISCSIAFACVSDNQGSSTEVFYRLAGRLCSDSSLKFSHHGHHILGES